MGPLRTALAVLAMGTGVLSAAALVSAPTATAASPMVRLSGADAVPHLPAGATTLGALPAGRQLSLDVTLAGQDPAGLSQFVAAVSTPGSPLYRHYLTPAQFAATYGPSAAEAAQVTAGLRAEGLTVGPPLAGSAILPVSGTAAAVSAALRTPLEAVRLADATTTFINRAAPEVPADLSGAITSIEGLDGLVHEHAMDLHGQPLPAPASSSSASGSSTSGSHALSAHVAGPVACAQAASAASSAAGYTSTQLASDFGLNQLFAQGRTGVGQTIALVEFEQYAPSDINAFESCYSLHNSISSVVVDGPVGGPQEGSSESALDIELAAVNAPGASIVVYEAPNEESDKASLDLFNRIASDDLAQVVSTSWGVCESQMAPGEIGAENTIFSRMAAQGQTMIAASGDSGSEDCFETNSSTGLSIDDPGAQPDVISAGGTTMTGGNVSGQSVWNNCVGQVSTSHCDIGNQHSNGAGGGGYSNTWTKPSWQPAATGLDTNPCGSSSGCRSVPDLSGPANPDDGVAAYFAGYPENGWTVYGGTSEVAPTNAALFADINQGCGRTLGLAGPSLYSVESASTFTDITTGNNDFVGTDFNSGLFAAGAGYDAATGLGTPQDQNLAPALQGSGGCPSVASLSTQVGPLAGSGAITISGGGFATATSVTFGTVGTGQVLTQTATTITVVPPSAPTAVCVDVTVTNPLGTSATSAVDHYGFGGATNCSGSGYRFVAADGGIFDFGAAQFFGSTGGTHLNAPIVGMATTTSGNGYWLVASDGGIFAFGDAAFYGSTGGIHLNKPIVGMATTPDGHGYWLVASDGGIFAFGDARFYGSTGSLQLNRPIVGLATTPSGGGYWLVASDGGIFTFGNANFYGSTGNIVLNKPIVGMAPTTTGNGYWLVASDGGIFTFGNANFFGSTGALSLNKPIVGLAPTNDSGGYWLVASDGGIFAFGDATFYGSTGGIHLNQPIVGMGAV